MKWLFYLLLTVLFLIVITAALLFTATGNTIITPMLERQLSEALRMPVTLTAFQLRIDHFQLAMEAGVSNRLQADGNISLSQWRLDARYEVALHDLSTLRPLTGQPLQGELLSHGRITGPFDSLDIVGVSDVARSQTHYRFQLIDFSVTNLTAVVKKARIADLLMMLKQTPYTDGLLFADLHLYGLKPDTRKGELEIKVKNGVVNRKTIAKRFALPRFPGAAYTLEATTKLFLNHTQTELSIDSTLLSLRANSITYDLNGTTIASPYTAHVPDLSKLNFLSRRPLQGKMDIRGNLRYSDTLSLHAHSNSFGGSIDARLDDQKLHADLREVDTLKALHTFSYPGIFDALMTGTFEYAQDTKQGTFNAALRQGRFTRNETFDLVKRYAKIDLYAERFIGTAHAKIHHPLIDADLNLHSNRSALKSKKARIDIRNDHIDAMLHVDANHNPVDLTLTGNINHPTVSVDASELIQRETGKQIQRLLNGFFK